MGLYILMGIVPVLAILVLILHRPQEAKKGSRRSRTQFYGKGKAAGFSFKEINILKNIAIQAMMGDYTLLFQSPAQMDTCIRTLARTMRVSGDEDPAKQDFLARLYEYRKKIEMEGTKQGITSSREISEGQNLRIVINNSAMYQARVIRNSYQYILITRPANPKIRTSISWTGQKLSIYFWKEGDAGYVFDCDVLDEVFTNGTMALQISHSDSLFRTQKRKSIRLKTHKSSFLYILNGKEGSHKLETVPGLKCIVEDLSDTGCSVTIGGKANKGMRVKLQFVLDKKASSMSGTVRSVEYNDETNRSLLHIEADPLKQELKNSIFGEVFGMNPGDDNFLSK
ncbi:PilZ domain-containing protein [Treponema primitia]|uniref:PilZ domain-containing protein n=1 Tax=Treponema primitia TaxID=88058 RepID=UPI000255507D|nr:PilZ domain-containing protein [Treponema primitia]